MRPATHEVLCMVTSLRATYQEGQGIPVFEIRNNFYVQLTIGLIVTSAGLFSHVLSVIGATIAHE